MNVTEPLRAEHRELLPRIGVTGAPGAAATMRREHVEVERLTAELERIRKDIGAAGTDNQQRRRLRQLLYGLHAVVGLHFIKEEEIYLPELDKTMKPPEAEAMFDWMEYAAAEVRRSSQG